MSDLEEIIKQNFITSYSQNIQFTSNLKNVFKTYYSQNVKYHILWLFLHSFSFAYPLEPSEEYKLETANFIYNIIPKNLGGCGGCQNDYKIFIENVNIFSVVSSRDEISMFFFDLHNHISSKKTEQNNRLVTNTSKHNITINDTIKNIVPTIYIYDNVKQFYTDTDYISLLEDKYSINMFTLIESKILASFYTEFNKINLETNGINFDINIQIT